MSMCYTCIQFKLVDEVFGLFSTIIAQIGFDHGVAKDTLWCNFVPMNKAIALIRFVILLPLFARRRWPYDESNLDALFTGAQFSRLNLINVLFVVSEKISKNSRKKLHPLLYRGCILTYKCLSVCVSN